MLEEEFRRLSGDRERGAWEIALESARLSLEALREGASAIEVLRLHELVVRGHPEMVVLANIHRILERAASERELELALSSLVDFMSGSSARIADRFAKFSEEEGLKSVITISWSSTVLECLRKAFGTGLLESAYVAESLPLGEGVKTAEKLRSLGLEVRVVPDSSIGHYVRAVDAAVVGADAVLRDGSLVNKVGTYLLALAARAGERALVSCASLLKVDVGGAFRGLREFRSEVGGIEYTYPLFDVTPSSLVTVYLTEEGPIEPRYVLEASKRALRALLLS